MAASVKPIIIIGGGLAGLTLGIGLRQHGVPAALWEAGHYPRHRVCGEFICGRGQETLARLGLRELLVRAGAVGADMAVFFPPTNPPGRCRCLHGPFVFRVSPWTSCSRTNSKSSAVNCAQASAGLRLEFTLQRVQTVSSRNSNPKASFTPRAGACSRRKAVRAGLD
jgi:2-polyprenyl-6-methoxyphenol hydroxylase-like FAD-dependent oxidoreductase